MATPSCFSAKIDLALKEKLKTDLIEQGFEISQPPYTCFSAKKSGISCTLYESGKLTVQGKEMGPFIEFYLEPEILKEFSFSNPSVNLDLNPRIGLDEAGKGDFFGPLCIAGVFADGTTIPLLQKAGVKDSKQLTDSTIIKIALRIKEICPHTVIRLFPLKYNELYEKFKNLNRLLAWAHTAALQDLSQKTGCKEAIIDQFAKPHVMDYAVKQKKLEVHLIQRTHAEEDLVVAAASILARSAFVDGMDLLSKECGMDLPKGASHGVIAAAKKLALKLGKEALSKYGKTHFKTMQHAELS
jgi:ribonuclease HIII